MGPLAVFFLVVVTLGLALVLAWLGWSTIPTNLIGWFLLISGLIYFVGVIFVYWIRGIRFWRPRANGEMIQQEKKNASFWFITLGIISIFYLPPMEYLYLKASLPRGVGLQILGLLIIVLGSMLFIWARRTLGNYYSGHVSVIDGQPLVQHGPYHFIRHPAYAGYLLIALGVSIGYSSVSGLLMTLGVVLPSVVYRIHIEDELLARHFGIQFADYAHKTSRLISGAW